MTGLSPSRGYGGEKPPLGGGAPHAWPSQPQTSRIQKPGAVVRCVTDSTLVSFVGRYCKVVTGHGWRGSPEI